MYIKYIDTIIVLPIVGLKISKIKELEDTYPKNGRRTKQHGI